MDDCASMRPLEPSVQGEWAATQSSIGPACRRTEASNECEVLPSAVALEVAQVNGAANSGLLLLGV